ncbi:DNA-binding CsgD family transcriptional regulator [Nocardioides ginsengisegetis]|uniref:DNA-binding CsgD family transcriptional regulator n=1 Tax=Nocardioides ginsengisegetis TaxID=661491 RepID=A0A7W3J280_9ACTN|nr:DNA-binding CsgD family transcriptional regulator [Nocardioides ginsengisegetis]
MSSYPAAQGITHVYDHAVSQEGLETVIALPIIVDDVPRIVVYLANRTQVGLGDRWFDSLAPLVRRLERDIAVEDEVRRRLDEMRECRAGNEGLTQSDLRELSDELAAVAEQVDDETLRARIELLRTRLSPSGTTTRRRAGVGLAPREVDVLTQVALGRTNREAAEQLGLLPNTVNSYLKTAMRKLGANNRVRAITAARETGLIT